jgi:hypothetical protein
MTVLYVYGMRNHRAHGEPKEYVRNIIHGGIQDISPTKSRQIIDRRVYYFPVFTYIKK